MTTGAHAPRPHGSGAHTNTGPLPTKAQRWGRRGALPLLLLLLACGDNTGAPSGLGGSGGRNTAVGAGGQHAAGGAGEGGGGGSGGGGSQTGALDALLEALRSDVDGAMLAQSRGSGWPAAVATGHLFVSTEPNLVMVAGDHDDWAGTSMHADEGFHWLVLQVAPGSRYKFTDGSTFEADPWSRAYSYDNFGVMSQLPDATPHLERHFRVSYGPLAARTVRVWLPAGRASHVLYAHDGQNLFDPGAPWGGWKLQQSIPSNMLVVAIDNTPARVDEYTHVTDLIDGNSVGGLGDAHSELLQLAVRPLIAQHYGEPRKVGLLGSSLGGLISLHTAQRYPDAFHFVASLSGTLGWGSIELSNGAQHETIIERFAAAGHHNTAIYLDSGGSGNCYDSDGDGIADDDPSASDNYCETKQLWNELKQHGYVDGIDLWYQHAPGAPHNEAAWAARVSQPLQAFAGR